jgi:amino acid transporter
VVLLGFLQVGSLFPVSNAFIFTDVSQAVYTLEGCETACQIAEEAKRAEFLAPIAVVGSIVGSWLIGLVYMLALLFSVQSIPSVQGTAYAIPIAQLYFDAVGKRLTLMCLTVIALAQFMAAVTAFTASSRLFYALARDNAFPAKGAFMKLNKYQAPWVGVWLSVLFGCIISCAYIGSIIAVSIPFSAEACIPIKTYLSVQCHTVLSCHSGHAGLPTAYHNPCVLAISLDRTWALHPR